MQRLYHLCTSISANATALVFFQHLKKCFPEADKTLPYTTFPGMILSGTFVASSLLASPPVAPALLFAALPDVMWKNNLK